MLFSVYYYIKPLVNIVKLLYNDYMSPFYQRKLDAWKERRKKFLELSQAGMSYASIGKQYHVSATAIYYAIKKAKQDISEHETEKPAQ